MAIFHTHTQIIISLRSLAENMLPSNKTDCMIIIMMKIDVAITFKTNIPLNEEVYCANKNPQLHLPAWHLKSMHIFTFPLSPTAFFYSKFTIINLFEQRYYFIRECLSLLPSPPSLPYPPLSRLPNWTLRSLGVTMSGTNERFALKVR